jgi:DNA-binding NtrC family response regulator
MAESSSPSESFSSRAFFERAADPTFLLNSRRRLRYANPAFERLVRQPLADIYNLPCVRDRRVEPLGQTLAPPPEVLQGSVAIIRRPTPPARVGPPWWDIAYFPLRSADGKLWGILGRITVIAGEAAQKSRALPDGVLQLKRRLPQRFALGSLEGESPAARRLLEQVRLARQLTAPLSVVGEPGTGKRWLARVIHHQGPTAERGFVSVDCAGLPPECLENLLFGDVGLLTDRTGTVFLREAGMLPRDLQSRMLEWLGSHEPRKVRLIASWTADALTKSSQIIREFLDAFRVFLIEVPPLRDRLDDLPRLTDALLHPLGKLLSEAALQVLRGYPWPGNLRELATVLRDAAERTATNIIEPEHLPEILRATSGGVEQQIVERRFPLKETLQETQRRLILFALRRAKGRKADAARLLDISRSELWRRMRELNIDDESWHEELPE